LWELPTERIQDAARTPAALKFTHTLTHRVLEIELAFKKSESARPPQKHQPWSGEYVETKFLALHEALSGKISLASVQKKMLRQLKEERASLFAIGG